MSKITPIFRPWFGFISALIRLINTLSLQLNAHLGHKKQMILSYIMIFFSNNILNKKMLILPNPTAFQFSTFLVLKVCTCYFFVDFKALD